MCDNVVLCLAPQPNGLIFRFSSKTVFVDINIIKALIQFSSLPLSSFLSVRCEF
jgi:hypothetical protein